MSAGLSPERVAALEFQAHNAGYSASTVEKWAKQGVRVDDLHGGAMISVTPREMAILIAAYKEKQACESPI